MAKTRKPKGASPKKLDPAKATIYVAVVTLLGAVIVAAISNVDKFRASPQPQPKSQAEEIIAFQEHKYTEISEVLEERASQAREEEKKLTTPKKARRATATRRATAIRQYIKDNYDTQLALAQKHGEFVKVVRFNDLFKANVIKTEVNTLLGKERESYQTKLGNVKGIRAYSDTPSYCINVTSEQLSRLKASRTVKALSSLDPPVSEAHPPVSTTVFIPRPRRQTPRSKPLAPGSKAVPIL